MNPVQRKRVQRLLTLAQYHQEQAQAMQYELGAFLKMALNIDIEAEAWTLDADTGLLTREEPASGQPGQG